MTKKYIVMERSFEYNDETYDESEGGTPRTLYETETEAQKVAKDLNFDALNTHGYLYEYNYEYEEYMENEDMTLEEAIKARGPIEVFYVVPVDAA